MQRANSGKDPDAGKDWKQEEKGETEDEMVGWHHQLNGNEFEQTLGDRRTGRQRVAQDLMTEQQQENPCRWCKCATSFESQAPL